MLVQKKAIVLLISKQNQMLRFHFKNFIKSIELVMGKSTNWCFGADMKVSLLNDGPVTILIDSKNKE
jgi:D-Tyr-tRNAtyr deacylase